MSRALHLGLHTCFWWSHIKEYEEKIYYYFCYIIIFPHIALQSLVPEIYKSQNMRVKHKTRWNTIQISHATLHTPANHHAPNPISPNSHFKNTFTICFTQYTKHYTPLDINANGSKSTGILMLVCKIMLNKTNKKITSRCSALTNLGITGGRVSSYIIHTLISLSFSWPDNK